jgi:hypothetical protein
MFLTGKSLMMRIAIGKTIGLIFGVIGFIFLTIFMPETTELFKWGILLWYTTLGAIIGMFGIMTYHPILKLPMPWWFRSSLMGAWMNLVLVFFTYDVLEIMMLKIFDKASIWSSPFWMVLEGAIIGLIIGYLATRFGGEGKEII